MRTVIGRRNAVLGGIAITASLLGARVAAGSQKAHSSHNTVSLNLKHVRRDAAHAVAGRPLISVATLTQYELPLAETIITAQEATLQAFIVANGITFQNCDALLERSDQHLDNDHIKAALESSSRLVGRSEILFSMPPNEFAAFVHAIQSQASAGGGNIPPAPQPFQPDRLPEKKDHNPSHLAQSDGGSCGQMTICYTPSTRTAEVSVNCGPFELTASSEGLSGKVDFGFFSINVGK
jgi:hypothetical protein